MDALLLVAHGSRHPGSSDEIRALAAKIAQTPGHQFDWVDYAFLEITEPSISEGVLGCVRKGAKHITVLPYFLATGRHVNVDIPTELEKARQEYPQVRITSTPYLGAAKEIPDILARLSQEAT
ncbi:MAG: cobalamin biosynthesis protein CbiX [Proteobacteria bacterium]|nr:cobalamin biosynthesis protein CbiX [Pseudomonadota bacterium]